MPEALTIGSVAVPGRVWIAPMTGVSDLPFRRAASRLGAAYVATEMVACAEFARGRPDVVRRAAVGDGLPLMVVQLIGHEPARSGRRRAPGRGGRGADHRPEFRLPGARGDRGAVRLRHDARPGPGRAAGGGRVRRGRRAGHGQDPAGLGRSSRNAPDFARRCAPPAPGR